MQTKLAFLFVLHVIALGIFLARRGISLRARNLFFVMSYLFLFYVAWGTAMQAVPAIYVPLPSGGSGEGASPAAAP